MDGRTLGKSQMWKHLTLDPNLLSFSCHTEERFNEFDILLHSEWDRAVTEGLFTFIFDDKTRCRKLDDGNLNYIIELNPSRYEKRRKPYPFENVNTPFDADKFNFNKIKDSEILFSLDDEQQTNKNLVIINNSPIRAYHVLLIPDRQLEQPQILTVNAILFGFKFVATSAHPYIFAGFNSVCGYASINHLHLHGMYVPDRLFAQTIKCTLFHQKSNCYLMDFSNTQAFGFEVSNINEFEQTAKNVFIITNYLTSQNIAHAMAIVKGDSFSSPSTDVLRIFVWPRQSVLYGKMFERCNFACLELAGYMPLQHEKIYNTLTEAEMIEDLNGIALSFDEQNRIKTDVTNLLNN